MSLTGKPALASAGLFSNDGFWPDLSLSDLMSDYRIPPEYADNTIKWGLTLAVTYINSQLQPVKDSVLLTHAAFEDYADANPAEIGGLHPLLIHYRHAVYAHAKAYLLQQFNSLNRKENAENAAKESADTEQWWLTESHGAVLALFNAVLPDQTLFQPQFGVHVALI
jgi:hypothetical protein